MESTFLAQQPIVTDEDVAAATGIEEPIDALREAYSRPNARDSTPDRSVTTTETGWLRFMPSSPAGAGFGGLEVISASVHSRMRTYLITLFDQQDSRVVATVDGNRITGLHSSLAPPRSRCKR